MLETYCIAVAGRKAVVHVKVLRGVGLARGSEHNGALEDLVALDLVVRALGSSLRDEEGRGQHGESSEGLHCEILEVLSCCIHVEFSVVFI